MFLVAPPERKASVMFEIPSSVTFDAGLKFSAIDTFAPGSGLMDTGDSFDPPFHVP